MPYTVIVQIIDEDTGQILTQRESHIKHTWDVTMVAKHLAQEFEHGEIDFDEEEDEQD